MRHRLFTASDDTGAALARHLPEEIRKAAAHGVNHTSLADRNGPVPFPVDTPERTIVSAVAAAIDNVSHPRVVAAIKSAVARFGVEDRVIEILDGIESTEKVASARPDGAVALEINGQGYYPINGTAQLVDSARALQEDYLSGALPPAAAHIAANAIVKSARARGVSLPEFVERHGEEREVSRDNAIKVAQLRAGLNGFTTDEVAMIVGGIKAASTDAELHDVLNAWASLDRAHGLRYDKVIDPYRAAYSGFTADERTKAASQYLCIGTEVVVPVSAFREAVAKHDLLEAQFGTELLPTIRKAASAADNVDATLILDELPDQHKSRLVDFVIANAS